MSSRRQFLSDVSKGMLLASMGSALASDLGISTAWADETAPRLKFGALEPLVTTMQNSTPEAMLPKVISLLKSGTDLKQIVAAAGLANVRTFGGEDYVGFHTMMALTPAYRMAQELPTDRQALPVLKVLYRNCNRLQEKGGASHEVLHEVPGKTAGASADALRDACRRKQLPEAEKLFAGLATDADAALNAILHELHDGVEVHRVVMVSRAWDMLDLVGRDHAHTLLRQSVHYCINSENENQRKYFAEVRSLLPQLLTKHQLEGKPLGKRTADDAWVGQLSETFFKSTPAQAAEAAALALAEGFLPDAIGEAITLAANQLVLRDIGRQGNQVQKSKPAGSVHGDSIGVHASDSANAWRNLAKVSNSRNAAACLILGAYQVAFDRINRGGDFLTWNPYPHEAHTRAITSVTQASLLPSLDEAIRSNEQARACALVARAAELGVPARDLFAAMLKFAISEDGALHAEKYYRTAYEEFHSTRPTYRWRQLVALARVTASEHGTPAPGYGQACELLGVK
jgi:hypothetical protein